MSSKIILLGYLVIPSLLAGQPVVRTSRTDNFYQSGETVSFIIRSTISDSVSYFVQRDSRTPPLAQGTIFATAGQERTVTYQPHGADFFSFSAQNKSGASTMGVGVGGYDLAVSESDPSDFDAFWAQQKGLLAAIGIDPKPTVLSSTQYSTTYSISLATVNNRRVYGYLSIPKGAGPFPAIITLPPYGASAGVTVAENDIAESGGAISLSISIHNAPPDQIDPQAYQPDNFSVRDGGYYRLAVLAGIRAIDYVYSRPEFDGAHLGLTGVSQGGGLAFLIGGVDSRVQLISASDPALADHTGTYYGKAAGFPQYFNQVRNSDSATIKKVILATKYIDAARSAKRFKGAAMLCAGYIDDVCPPATTFELYNQLTGVKLLVHDLDLGHTHPEEYWNGRFDFWRRFFPSMRTPPKPFIQATTGYFIDPGQDTVLAAGSKALKLNAKLAVNGAAVSNFPVVWKKTFGAGAVTFSSSKGLSTSASFDQAGDYYLTVYAEDTSKLSANRKFTIAKTIKVTALSKTVPVLDVNNGGASIFLRSVYPNPAKEQLNLSIESAYSGVVTLQIVNELGGVSGEALKTLNAELTRARWI